MPRHAMLYSILFLALSACGPEEATSVGTPDTAAARFDQVDAFVGQFVDLAMFDGMILVDRGGEVIYEKAFGLANVEHNVANTVDTRFRIASVSKNLTDAALAKVMADGTFDRDTALATFLPDFPKADRITIGHLLDHSSGVPHTNAQPWGDGKTSLTLDEIIARLAEMPLDFEPGTGEVTPVSVPPRRRPSRG